jgi:hypothetical protein
MNSSQMPFGTSRRIGWARPCHWLKSPTTLTRSALGAHTAKYVPVADPIFSACEPRRSKAR